MMRRLLTYVFWKTINPEMVTITNIEKLRGAEKCNFQRNTLVGSTYYFNFV